MSQKDLYRLVVTDRRMAKRYALFTCTHGEAMTWFEKVTRYHAEDLTPLTGISMAVMSVAECEKAGIQ